MEEESEWCLAYTPMHPESSNTDMYLLSWLIGMLLGTIFVVVTT